MTETPTLPADIIRDIHHSPWCGVLAITGGGSAAISQLLATPGASRTVLEALVPYHPASLKAFIQGATDQACSASTARSMAMAAYQRARLLTATDGDRTLFGLGSTAALSTDRVRRGSNRIFVAIQTREHTREFSLLLDPQDILERDREDQEKVSSDLIVAALATTCHLPVNLTTTQHPDRFEQHTTTGLDSWQRLLNGELNSTHPGGKLPSTLFPGAFNPLHEGHRTMVAVAEKFLNQQVTLEISAFNVDKPPLNYFDMQLRAQSIGDHYPLVFTRAPTFVEKSSIFPGVTFVVGVDTITRIAEPRYYNHQPEQRDNALDTFARRGNRFLVFGRRTEANFVTLDDVRIPEQLRVLCDGVDEAIFRHDISSSELRSEQGN